MKQLLFTIAFFFVYPTGTFAQKIPITVGADGKVMNRGRYLGTLKLEGGFDQNGKLVSTLERSGITVDSSGRILGNVPQGRILTYICNGKPQNYFVSKAPNSNNYLIKNAKGKTYILLDKRYKSQAISAIHFIYDTACVL